MSTSPPPPTKRPALLVLGGVGTLVCLLCIGGVWWVEWRLNLMRQNLVAGVDRTLEAVHERLVGAGRLVDEAKLTTGEVQQRLSKWTRDEVTDRVAERLELSEWLDRLDHGFEQTDQWLAFAELPTAIAEDALEWGQAAGLSVDTHAVGSLADQVTELRTRLHSLSETVEELQSQLAGDGPDEPGRIAQAARTAGRLVATFGNLAERLTAVAEQVTAAREETAAIAGRTRSKMLLAAATATLLLMWMAAGQISLARRGLGK